MPRPLLPFVVLALAAFSLAQGDAGLRTERRAATRGFPEPVDVLGVRVALTNLAASINVQGPPNPGAMGSADSPSTARSIGVSGTVTPLSLLPASEGKSRKDQADGPTAVLRAEITRLVGDDGEVDVTDTSGRTNPAWGAARARQQLSQALLGNPHALLAPPPHLTPEQLAAMRSITGGFNASARLQSLPARIDRLEVSLDLVHAANMDVVTLPLEAMAEHKEVAPGVRFLVRDVRGVEHGGRSYTRVEIEYFIDRRPADGETGFEATPLVPAVAIRDGRGQIVHMLQRVQETETRDQFIVSIGDISLGADAGKAGPLTVDVVVLHGLERRSVELRIEDLPLAGD